MRIAAFAILLVLSAIEIYSQEQMQVKEYNYTHFEPEASFWASDEMIGLTNQDAINHPEFGFKPFNAQCDDCFEIIDRRSEDTRYFVEKNSRGSRFYIQQANGPLHFRDEGGNWVSLDYRLKRKKANVYESPDQYIPILIDMDKGFSALKLMNNTQWRINQNSRLFYESGGQHFELPRQLNTDHTAGSDGVLEKDVWYGIDRVQTLGQGKIKTNYIINKPLPGHLQSGWWVFEEEFNCPEGLKIVKELDNGITSPDGLWQGDLLLVDENDFIWGRISSPIVYDADKSNRKLDQEICGFQLEETPGGYKIRVIVSASWLNDPSRVFPITVDPLVTGTNTYTTGVMGFESNPGATCWANYCPYTMNVTVPGQSTIISAVFNSQYLSLSAGCSPFQCWMSEASFRISGPCGLSPGPTTYWTCAAPGGNAPGNCSGTGLNMLSTVGCTAPSCANYNFTFEMRNRHCSCNTPSCAISCHNMPVSSWVVTIQARTVESSVNVTSGSSTICIGGGASLSATGSWGVPPYSYSWSPGGQVSSSIVVTPITTTAYTCTITDACGNTSSASTTITVNPLPTLTFATSDVSCFGGSDGSATVNSNTSGPYTIFWGTTPVQTTQTASNLPAGTYNVTLTDGNNCTNSASVTINQPAAPLSVTVTGINPTCNGGSDGSATAVGTGGTTAYSFAWNTSPAQSGNTATGLSAGTYTVTITDANNCTSTNTVVLNQPTAITLSTSTGSTSCNGGSDGTASVTASGGAGNFTYAWSTSPVQTTSTATGLSAGNYTVTVTDVNNCTQTATVNVSEPTAISISISTTNVSCNGGNDGTATASGAGGTGAITYSWNTVPVQNSATASGLAAGTYVVTATDVNNCTQTASVTITEPAALTLSTTVLNASCNGLSDGSATVTPSGGTPGFTYAWNTIPAQSTATATGLAAGNYIVTVTDNNNCTQTASVTISQPSALSISTTATNVSCGGGSDGTATANPNGGTGPYTYLWNTTPAQSTATATGLAAGNYIVTVTDANNCTQTASVTISQPAVLSISTAVVNTTCFGSSDGSATAVPAGGTPSFIFAWSTSPVQTTSTATGLSAGNYTVTVTDANNCTQTATVNVSEPTAISISISTTNVSCNGGSDGSATASGAGGTGAITYSWNTVPVQNSATASGLAAGTYVVTATDVNNCTQTASVTITEPAALTLSTTVLNASCNSLSDGSATVTPSGGTPGFTYAWNTVPAQSTATATGLAAGNYIVTVTDNNNCTQTASVTITEPSAITISISTTNATCGGAANGTATAGASGGTGPYTYLWNTNPAQSTATATGLAAGNYIVTVTDNGGCTQTATAIVNQPGNLSLSATTLNVLCAGDLTGSATVSVSGGTPPYGYAWNTVPVQATPTASGLAAGTYSIVVTDANNCSQSLNVTITEPPPITIATTTSNVSCNGLSDGMATANVSGGSPGFTFAWNTSPVQTTSTVSNLVAGSYTVTVSDNNGCVQTASVNISEPSPLTVSVSSINVDCNGAGNGSATANPIGGTSPYNYLWSTTPAQNAQTAIGLSGGNYIVTVTDNNGCAQTASTIITEPSAIILSTTSVNVSCFGANNGLATVSVSGGSPGYSYTWNTSPVQTTATANNLPAGTYTVTVSDANNCANTTSVVITQPANLVLTSAVTNATCFGYSDGSAVVTASGGSPPFSYAWNTTPVQSTSTATNLSSGSYFVTVTDANNCSQSAMVTITAPAAITLNISNTNVSCNGGNDGSATVSGTGGSGALTYLWNTSPVQSGTIATGLTAGNYTVTATDANNCSQTTSITITEPSAIVLTTSSTDASCGGIADGTASVSATGGSPGYNYLWNTTPAQTTATAVNLVAGNYSVTVTDNNGCTQSATVIVNQPGNMSVTVSATHVNCFGGTSGTATATPTGGTPPYTYSWNTSPAQTTATATGLLAGNYTVTVTDANGCTFAINVAINQPAAISSLTNITNVSCNGMSDGSAQLNPSGGTSPYSYQWNTVPAQTGQTAIGLAAGNYVATITDANACSGIVNIIITEPQQLSISTTSTAVSCNNLADGQASVTATGGVGPYSYLWNTVPVQITQSASGLTAGTYSIQVTDANGCQQTASVTISQPSAISVNTSIINVSCFGLSDGSASISVSGGTPGYTYLWNTVPVQTTAMATNLAAGNYTATVSDNNNCTQTASVVITQPAAMQITLTKTDITCNGGSDGAISTTVSGGAVPYSFVWNTNPVQTTPTITNLSQGTYVLTVTDNNGCAQTASSTIIQPPVMVLTTSSTNVSCNGYNDGTASVNVNGGNAPYSYQWNTSPPQTSQSVSALGPGNYSVTVTDANGCQQVAGVAISQPPPMITSTSILNATCFGGNDGSASISISGGSGPFTYLWSTNPPQTTSSVNNLSAGNYTATVTDANGCDQQINITVNQPADIAVILSPTDASCYGYTDGQIATSVSGGTPGYAYAWNTTPVQTGPVATDLGPGSYTVTVSDNYGCTKSASASVSQPTQIQTTLSATHVSCNGYNDGRISITASGGTGPYTYQWSNGGSSTSISGLGPGSYDVTITDNAGCTTVASGSITEPPPIVVNPGIDKTVVEGNSTVLDITITPAGNYVFMWSPPATLDDPNTQNPTAHPVGNTTYTVIVTDPLKGCSGNATINVTIIPDLHITLPNAFSPNGDLVNDVFFEFEFLELLELRIFNRWGTLVYEGNLPWDGLYNGVPQPVDSYLYHALVRIPNTGAEFILKGNITLLR